MKRPGAILVADRFPELRIQLLELLRDLSDEDWRRRTAAPLWSVKDVAAHLLGGDVGILSRQRDQFSAGQTPIREYRDLIQLVNELNDQWVLAAQRMSPGVLCDLLEFTGPRVEEYFASLDPFALGGPVSWAGSDAAPVWFDVAREFTERWHHQQQIRDATGRPPLYDPQFFAPVLDTFVRALPYSFSDISAANGTILKLEIVGEAGGTWFLRRTSAAWELLLETGSKLGAEVIIPQDMAWRIFTKGISGDRAQRKAEIRGDEDLASRVFNTIAVIG